MKMIAENMGNMPLKLPNRFALMIPVRIPNTTVKPPRTGMGMRWSFACVGIIDDILYFGYFQDIGIYPASTEQGDQSGHKDLQ